MGTQPRQEWGGWPTQPACTSAKARQQIKRTKARRDCSSRLLRVFSYISLLTSQSLRPFTLRPLENEPACAQSLSLADRAC
eukprot:3100488-Pleurochrysis_carterae.AAC.2